MRRSVGRTPWGSCPGHVAKHDSVVIGQMLRRHAMTPRPDADYSARTGVQTQCGEASIDRVVSITPSPFHGQRRCAMVLAAVTGCARLALQDVIRIFSVTRLKVCMAERGTNASWIWC